MSHSTVLVIGQPTDNLRDASWLDDALAPFNEDLSVDPYRRYVDPLPEGWEVTMANGARFDRLMETGVERREAWRAVWGEKNDDPYVPTEYRVAIENNIDPHDDVAVAAFMSDHWEEEYLVDGQGIYQMSRYNPRSRWDWWQLGGRWSGFFKLRVGGEGHSGEQSWAGGLDSNGVDLVRKGDVDWEAMLAAAALRAVET